MERTLTVALLQLTAHPLDTQANLEKGVEWCRRARERGADIALFPEMWSIGYAPPFPEAFDDPFRPDRETERKRWIRSAVRRDGPFINRFRMLARELEMAIGITYLEAWPEKPRNTFSLIDRFGEIRMTYAKVHTCDFSMEALCTPGDRFYVADLNTEKGTVRVGAMICFDREFPESARILMLKGAELILTPNACHLDQHRLSQFKSRAFENMVGVAMANYASPQYNGHSVAYSPIVYKDGRAVDNCLVLAGEEEGIFIARFDMDEIRDYRRRGVWGNAYRKTKAYSDLISEKVEEPFVRKPVHHPSGGR